MRNFSWIFTAVVLLQGCRTPTPVIVERVRNDTVLLTTERRDSIWLHDSVFFALTGDTVRIERWRTKYVECVRTDTVYKSRVDSVPVPYSVERLVARNLTWWQRLKMTLGVVFMGMLGFIGVYGFYRLRRRLPR